MVFTWKKVDNLYFDSDASIIRRVGRESISNPIVAIVELIKNSYDADATKVQIILENIEHGKGSIKIIDNGSGMTPEELSKKWMILATDDKEKNPVTSKTRIKIGEKGIGRVGIEGISEKVEIISKPINADKMYRIEIDWNNYSPGILLDKIPNSLSEAPKNKREHGFEIIMSDLISEWDEEKVKQLKEQVSLITTLEANILFDVEIKCKDYPTYEGKVENKFLKNYIYHFKAELDKNNNAKYSMKQRKGTLQKLEENNLNLSCGPLYFEFYFFYRKAQRYPDKETNITEIKNILDSYGGIKLYRDDFLVKLQKADWLGLNQMRVQDPSIIPGTDQVFGFVKITKLKNQLIKDTTNREGLIENGSCYDMITFLKKAIENFKLFRKQAEYYEGKRKKKTVEEQFKEFKKSKKKVIKEKPVPEKEFFIDFGKQYPDIFYKKLEDEINQCYESKLPNATLILSRKMIENLIYNVLYFKFPKKVKLRFDTKHRRSLGFSTLLDNLELNKEKFEDEQIIHLEKAISLIKPFIKQANSKTHSIMEYLDDITDLEKFKIPEIIQTLLNLIHNINNLK